MPSLGLLIGLPITILILLVSLAVAIVALYSDDSGFVCVCALITAGVTFLLAAVAFFPYQHDYHFYTDVRGNVTQVSKRLVSAGDSGMQEKIVVVVNGQPYGVTDTRASLLKIGDPVHLNCKKAFEFRSTSGWDCRWKDVG